MSIRRLPDDVVDKIRSSAAVTSLNEVACGLLKNSLDAGCTKANIRLDYVRGNCTVEDDGLGIEPREFGQDGGLGRLHHTSRIPPSPAIHGSRGDFLASLANLSLLSVTSHHHRHVSQSSISIHNSKVLARQVPAPPEQRLETFNQGTRVSVRALFGSMPVRVKHRASVFSERSGIDKEWGHLVRELVALLLAWPAEVSVSLSETAARRELRLRSTGNADVVTRTSRLFTQASMADSSDASSWIPISASARRIRIKGCISVNPVATRRSQVMSLGIQPILNSQDSNVLYEAVNKAFSNSSFGVIENEENHDMGDTGPKAKSRKGLERWPMFYLQIMLPSADMLAVDDMLNDSQKVLVTVLELLKAVCYEFLKKQCLRPRAVEKPSGTATLLAPRTATPLARSSTRQSLLSTEPKTSRPSPRGSIAEAEIFRPESPFDDWNRVKIGRATPQGREPKWERGRRSSERPRTNDRRHLVGEGGKLLCMPFSDAPTSGPDLGGELVSVRGHENAAGEEGLVVASAVKTGRAEPKQQPKRFRVLESRPKPQPSEWLQGVLGSWENPVFETTQTSVPQVNGDAPTADAAHLGCGRDRCVNFEAGSTRLDGRLSRSALADAEIIAQVDRKFILVKLPLEPTTGTVDAKASSALVMVDQHAADERCRLEELLASYFKENASTGLVEPVVEALERPVVFEASAREGELLERYQEHFESWGVLYQIRTEAHGRTACRIRVMKLPPSILERCRSEVRVLIDLVRKEVWALEDGNAAPCRRNTCHEPGKSSTARFHGCPSGILELLHSRSCRSAIMFNDELSRDECAQLVQTLARCEIPFQCAHGRPSMVPLADLGEAGTDRFGGWRDERPVQVEAWKRWLEG